ncbi:MAG: hypothetical protein ACN4GZ_01630 [Acidimicrobiales bacterium]
MHTIPLATFQWQRTEPCLEVHAHTINLSLPSRLGDLPWMLDRSEVAIVDTRDQITQLDDDLLGRGEQDFSFLNVPYLATSTAAAPPTTGLLFVEPKRHPGLGLLDGFLVREANPGQLIDLAAALGMETASDLRWFADHRRTAPGGASSARSTIRRVENAGVASAAAGGGLFFLAAGQSMHHRTGRLGLVMLLAGAGVAVVSDWLGRHRSLDGHVNSTSDGTLDPALELGERIAGDSDCIST